MALSILENNNIPAMKQYRKGGGLISLYTGVSNLLVDIYVPSKLIVKANELLSILFDETIIDETLTDETLIDEMDTSGDEFMDSMGEMNNSRFIIGRFLFILVAIALILSVGVPFWMIRYYN